MFVCGERSHLFQVKGEGHAGQQDSDYSVLTHPSESTAHRRATRFTELLCLFVFSCREREQKGAETLQLNCAERLPVYPSSSSTDL